MKARIAKPAFAEASQDFCFCSTTPKYSSDPGNCTRKRIVRQTARNILIYITFRRLIWPSRTTVTRKSKRKPLERPGKMPSNHAVRGRPTCRLSPDLRNPSHERGATETHIARAFLWTMSSRRLSAAHSTELISHAL